MAADLPDDLCSLGEESLRTATCSMTGVSPGEPVTLDGRITSYGCADVESADSVAFADLGDSCIGLKVSGVGMFEDSETGCTQTSPDEPADDRGSIGQTDFDA